MLNASVIFGLSQKGEKGLHAEDCACVYVCVCRRCQERQCEVSSREIRGEAGKSMLTHRAVTSTKYTKLAGERERKVKRKTDRKRERLQATNTQSDNPAEVLLAVFMFAASFHHSACCWGQPHNKCFFFFRFLLGRRV